MSTKRDEAREEVPEEVRGYFDQLVDEYIFHCQMAYGRPHVSYKVLAELVKAGWRPSARAE